MVGIAMLVMTLITIACGPPESFDGLVGARPQLDAGPDGETGTPPIVLRPDDSLPAPRLVAPVSGSWINSSRPRFRWKHALTAAIGARVELCRTRACDTADKKTFEAGGTELTLTEDLPPGTWFWRVYAKTAETFGTVPSAPWQIYIRGGLAKDSSPAGTIFDFNGDGRPDLMATLLFESPPFDGGVSQENVVVVFTGGSDDFSKFALEVPDGGFGFVGVPVDILDTSVAVGDVDGDGFTDFIFHDQFGVEARRILVGAGSVQGLDITKTYERITKIPLEEPPILTNAGDLDGDGWSDLFVTTRSIAYAIFGTEKGLGPFQIALQLGPDPTDGGTFDAGFTYPTKPLAAVGAYDHNADGFSDIALGDPFSEIPSIFLLGGVERKLEVVEHGFATTPIPAGASSIVAGDFDGDGITDIALATTSGGKPAVCVQLANEPIGATKLTCFIPDPAPAGFASSLTVGDIEPDGRDEILVGSTSSGIDILRLKPEGLIPEHLATTFGSQLTTIMPGRPGPAVWAALRSDGGAIAIFKGKDQTPASIALPFDAKRFGQRLR